MNEKKAGFREVEHTADVEVEVWGEDKASLFTAAAKGMYHLSQTHKKEGEEKRFSRFFSVRERDLESLLVAFLSELLFYLETEQLLFDRYHLDFVDANHLQVQLEGGRIQDQDREIKAVTFHDLDIKRDNSLWKVNIVFDV